MNDYDPLMMNIAIEMALTNIDEGGGPFGAVVTYKGKLIAKAGNRVTSELDPTAHAEINAIRIAARKINSYDLEGCCLYSTCEPCPMCFGAIYWSRISKVYYALDRNDASKAGFDDGFIYKEIVLPERQRTISFNKVCLPSSGMIFDKWVAKSDKKTY